MDTISLADYICDTDFSDVEDKFEQICKITKTTSRIKPLKYLTTQSKIMYKIANNANATSFFEIGTGRGTTCYSLSLLDKMKKIVTLDIVPFDKVRDTFYNFKSVKMSNKAFYDMIPFNTKAKITFLNATTNKNSAQRYGANYYSAEDINETKFDLIFIDGNHKVKEYILHDYKIAKKIASDKATIVFDDYGPDWAVTEVVDEIIKNEGHMYNVLMIKTSEPNNGIVLFTKI